MVTSRFPVVRRGYEPKAVDAALAELADLAKRVEHAEATTLAARTYAASLLDELDRLHALEDELTFSLDLARQTGQRILDDAAAQAAEMIADAEVQAGARLAVAELEARHHLDQANEAATRALTHAAALADARWADADQRATTRLQEGERHVALRLAAAEHRAHALLNSAQTQAREQRHEAETRSVALLAATELTIAEQVAEAQAALDLRATALERYRRAVLEEIDLLGRAEARLDPRLSRAAARLIEVVDGPDGLGAFSHTTDTLVTLARLLQRTNAVGALARVELAEQDGELLLRARKAGVGTPTAGSQAEPQAQAVGAPATIDLRAVAAPDGPELPMVSAADPAADPSLDPPVTAPRLHG